MIDKSLFTLLSPLLAHLHWKTVQQMSAYITSRVAISEHPNQECYKLLVNLAKEFYETNVYFFNTSKIPKSMFGWPKETILHGINGFHLEVNKTIYLFQPDHRVENLAELCIVLAHEMGHAAAEQGSLVSRQEKAARVITYYYENKEFEFLNQYLYAEDIVKAYRLILDNENTAWRFGEDLLKLVGFTDWTIYETTKNKGLSSYYTCLRNRQLDYLSYTMPLRYNGLGINHENLLQLLVNNLGS